MASHLSTVPIHPEESFDIELFNTHVNDDIFRIVLSYLNVQDLIKLHLVSQSLRICQLTTEDQYWRDFYFKKIDEFRKAQLETITVYQKDEDSLGPTTIFDEYLHNTSNFKSNLIEAIECVLSFAERKSMQRTIQIEKIKKVEGGKEFIPISKVLEYKHLNETLKKNNARYKIFQVGDGAIGKTCLFMSYANGTFPQQDYVPTVFESNSLHRVVEGVDYCIDLWDRAGAFTDFDRLRLLDYLETDLFLVSFSCISQASLDNVVSRWIPELIHYCPDVPIALVSTKADYHHDPILNKKFILQNTNKPITFEQGELMAKKMGCMTFIETSAKTRHGLDNLSEVMMKLIAISRDTNYVSVSKSVNNPKKCLVQ